MMEVVTEGRYNRGRSIGKKSYEQWLLSNRRQGTSGNSEVFVWNIHSTQKNSKKKPGKLVRARFWESLKIRVRHFLKE